MKLAVRIQSGGNRDRWVKAMFHMLGNDRRIESVASETPGLWESAKATLSSYHEGDTHMLVMQDDILPCADLIKTADALIEILPSNPITLFSNKETILRARQEHKNYVTLRRWLMAQAYIVPIPTIEDFLSWAERHIKPNINYDDNRWAMYLFYHGILTYATAPSLVEHIGWNDTTLRYYAPNTDWQPRLRMAKWFIGFEKHALAIDWSKTDAVADNDGGMSEFAHYYID